MSQPANAKQVAAMSTTIATPALAPTAAMPRSPAQLALRRFLHRPVAVAGLAVIVLFIGVAIFAPLIAPYDPIATSWTAIRKAPSLAHWMGTDENGRDVLSRVIFGARASLLAGVVSVLIAAGIGVPAGLLAGFAGGWTDVVLSRIVDAMLACPFLILAIALAAFLGPDLTNAMIAIGVSTAPRFMRVTRAATLDASSNEYVEAARAIGNPAWRIAVRHVLPNIVPPIMVQGTLAIAAAIIAVAVYLPERAARAGLVLAIIVAAVIWVVGQNFGMILAGGATDPNSGPLPVLLALAYWPARTAAPSLAAEGTAI